MIAPAESHTGVIRVAPDRRLNRGIELRPLARVVVYNNFNHGLISPEFTRRNTLRIRYTAASVIPTAIRAV